MAAEATTRSSRSVVCPTLLVKDGGHDRRCDLPNGEVLIGRRPDCDLVLDAPSIAPRHARVFTIDGHATLYGLASEWPVYVNGDAVTRHPLCDGDSIELAHYRLRYVGGQSDSPLEQPLVSNVEASGSPGHESVPVAGPGVSDAVPAGSSIVAEEPLDTDPVPGEPDLATPTDARYAPERVETGNQGAPVTEDVAPAGAEAQEPHPEPRPDLDTDPEDATGTAPHGLHLDILSGINQGRRIALLRDRIVLGFNGQELMEIRNHAGQLWVRRLSDETDAYLNDETITDESTTVEAGDVLSVHRIDMRFHDTSADAAR